jgi:hypothetical protein
MKISEITRINDFTCRVDLQKDKDNYLLKNFLGRIKNLEIYWSRYGGDKMEVVGKERGTDQFVFVLDLFKTSLGWYVDMSQVDCKYQGFGIMPEVYAFILNNLPGDFVLRAGSSQSPGGQQIWKKLAQRDDVVVFTKQDGEIIELEYDPSSDEIDTLELKHHIYDKDHLTMYAIAQKKMFK